MEIKTESKTTIEARIYSDNGILKTHNTELGGWYSDEICREVDFDSYIKEIGIPNGEHKVTIIIERIEE